MLRNPRVHRFLRFYWTDYHRLGLNVASTKLILLKGDAGNVIESFGRFRGNNLVGAVVFLILVAINFMVITGSAESQKWRPASP